MSIFKLDSFRNRCLFSLLKIILMKNYSNKSYKITFKFLDRKKNGDEKIDAAFAYFRLNSTEC